MHDGKLVWLPWKIISGKIEDKRFFTKIDSFKSQIKEVTHLLAGQLKKKSTSPSKKPQAYPQANENSSSSDETTSTSPTKDP